MPMFPRALFATLAISTLAIATLALSMTPVACDKAGDGHEAPAAPAMPAAWKVELDQTFDHNEREFLETEGRLEGMLASLRVTIYDVNGRRVRLNTLVPKSEQEGDKIFRILANKKAAWSYLRKNEVLYEFIGPIEAQQDIVAAREQLSH